MGSSSSRARRLRRAPRGDHVRRLPSGLSEPRLDSKAAHYGCAVRPTGFGELGPRTLEVRDFKTGATLDERGEIKEGIALQLQAYGLLLLESQPGADVRLVVDDGEEREVPFDFDARRKATDEVMRITGSMPPAGPASAEELTRPGSSCLACSIRHVCPAYRATAPAWWKQ